MGKRLEGKVCIITGTGGSMGQAAARRFAEEGARIVGCDLNPKSGEAILREVTEAGGEMVSLHPCDLTKAQDCASLVDLAVRTYGRVDVLYNNAAMAYFNWIEDISDEEWQKNIDQELTLVFLLTRAAWPHLKMNGGSIINAASVTAWTTMPVFGTMAHSASKAGVIAMTRNMAMEGRKVGIRANSISPGMIVTNQTAEHLKVREITDYMFNRIMVGRPGTPEEIANVALFLASDESSYINGTDLRADGGLLA
ncbi:SDR family NAD(P)-dependent oxidoreductase [Pseudomonas syringae]|uniref:SDR family NAD(P)-dependent oxidoreductase n=1 Tax=Pseudomonas syringae TaxID=317 RepID=UPI001F0D4EC0|nr:SDR family oxidoreductase [Pseudomonas syringae]MCH5487755.1 SDR family oxidoreductase [Pseudomonas syringae pv. syringae]MDO1458898.1 SDR family oxidoreductase [Pseudomonas syringae pv. syringae]